MRLLQFEQDGQCRIGIEAEDGDHIINLNHRSSEFPENMVDFLAEGEKMIDAARRYAETCNKKLHKRSVKILPPLTKPGKIACVGMNYRDHCIESQTPVPSEPVIFNKFPSSIIGNGDPILIPKLSNAVDWEAELAVVIGKRGKNIEVAKAIDYVAGFTIANDVTARDWYRKKNGGQVLLGKSFDTFCPLGPVIVTKDSLQKYRSLRVRCLVNDEIMQDSCTSQLIFNVEECISWISRFCTLEPGDLILTGTPPGSGTWRNPPIYLKDGDMVSCEVDYIGKLTNPVARSF